MPLLPAFLTRLINKSCASACRAARFPRVNEHTPAPPLGLGDTRACFSHRIAKVAPHDPDIHSLRQCHAMLRPRTLVRGNEIFGKNERPAPLVTHGRARHFPAPGKREWPLSPYGAQSLTCLEYFARRLIRSVRPDRMELCAINRRWCQFRRVFANLTVNGCPYGQFGGCHLFHPRLNLVAVTFFTPGSI